MHFEPTDHGTVMFTKRSALSMETHTLEIPIDVDTFIGKYDQFQAGLHVQKAFPELDADLREFILSGITPEEWQKTFGK